MRYAVSDRSGNILRQGSCGSVEQVEIQAGPDELAHVVPDDVSDPEAYSIIDGEWYLLPTVLPTLDDLKEAAFRRVRILRDVYAGSGCDTVVGRVDTTAVSLANVTLNGFLASQQPSFTTTWRMADNSEIVVDAPQMIAMASTCAAHTNVVQARKNALDGQIRAATTPVELDAIDLEAGWDQA